MFLSSAQYNISGRASVECFLVVFPESLVGLCDHGASETALVDKEEVNAWEDLHSGTILSI